MNKNILADEYDASLDKTTDAIISEKPGQEDLVFKKLRTSDAFKSTENVSKLISDTMAACAAMDPKGNLSF